MKARVSTSERIFRIACLAAVLVPLAVLATLAFHVLWLGLARIDWSFLTSYPSRFPEKAGILPGLAGTLYLIAIAAVVSLPIGIGTAIYLREYGARSRIARFVELNIANLAGVPSVIYGLLGLEVFARTLGLGGSVLAGGLTLALLVLPMVTITAREAIRAVPDDLREAGMALGATRWSVVRTVVLPLAFPNILTGTIFAVSRAIGEAAPLVVLGAVAYLPFVPTSLDAQFTALPVQIFHWVSRPEAGFTVDAAAGIIVLLVTLVVINGAAIVVRNRYTQRGRG
jgi:phosphate transport system permease protein